MPNVLANDTLAGAAATLSTVQLTQVSSTSSYIQLATHTGAVFVFVGAPAGAHTLRYRICELATPLNCAEAVVNVTVVALPIDAVNDAGTRDAEWRHGRRQRPGERQVQRGGRHDRQGHDGGVVETSAGLTLNTATGAVSVAPATAPGSYALVYRICEIANPTNCDSATVTVTVNNYPIDAVNDSTRAYAKPPSAVTILPSVLANDWYAGVRATTSTRAPDAGVVREPEHRARHRHRCGEAVAQDRLRPVLAGVPHLRDRQPGQLRPGDRRDRPEREWSLRRPVQPRGRRRFGVTAARLCQSGNSGDGGRLHATCRSVGSNRSSCATLPRSARRTLGAVKGCVQ